MCRQSTPPRFTAASTSHTPTNSSCRRATASLPPLLPPPLLPPLLPPQPSVPPLLLLLLLPLLCCHRHAIATTAAAAAPPPPLPSPPPKPAPPLLPPPLRTPLLRTPLLRTLLLRTPPLRTLPLRTLLLRTLLLQADYDLAQQLINEGLFTFEDSLPPIKVFSLFGLEDTVAPSQGRAARKLSRDVFGVEHMSRSPSHSARALVSNRCPDAHQSACAKPPNCQIAIITVLALTPRAPNLASTSLTADPESGSQRPPVRRPLRCASPLLR